MKFFVLLSVIEAAPKITLDKREYKVKQGEDVTIEVKFTSTPPPQEEWSVNGTVIKKSKRIIPTITESSASLTITKVEEKDVGEYTIVLTNSVGEASEKITVIIMGMYNFNFKLNFASIYNSHKTLIKPLQRKSLIESISSLK